MSNEPMMHVRTNRDGVVSRRTFLRSVAASAAGLGMFNDLTLHADELRRQNKACILLFMRGGPSQFETFDPKPGHANGGPTQAIQTAVPGIRIAQNWTNVAREMRHISVIRSMTSREGEHQRAVYQMHSGYLPVGGVRFPSIGAVVASEIAPRDFDLPHFVSVGGRFNTHGSGFLGMHYAPFIVNNPTQMPGNAELPRGTDEARFSRRLSLMEDLERDFAESGGEARVREHRATVNGAANLVRSPRLQAFDLSRESSATRDRYGRNNFGQGCLLARRLVEAGVTFVEVELNGWDTHINNFETTNTLSGEADSGFAAIVQDVRRAGHASIGRCVIYAWASSAAPRVSMPTTAATTHPRAFSVAGGAGTGIRGGRTPSPPLRKPAADVTLKAPRGRR